MKRKMIKLFAAALVMALAVTLTGFAETVTNVRGLQRPNSKLVDIYYDLNASDGGTYTVEVAIEGRTDTVTAKTFSGDIGKGVVPGKNRHVVWDVGADRGNKKGDVRALVTATTEDKRKKVQLWEGGPYWADRNIGAKKPSDYGLYFWWGDTMGHSSSYNFSDKNFATEGKSVSYLQSNGWITSGGTLAPAHDAAHVKWDNGWRMPTYAEFSTLINNCVWKWTTRNGVRGYVVRGRGTYASNSIFLPCAGFVFDSVLDAGSVGLYWSSVPSTYDAWGLNFGSINYFMYEGTSRDFGCSVRPVQGFAE